MLIASDAFYGVNIWAHFVYFQLFIEFCRRQRCCVVIEMGKKTFTYCFKDVSTILHKFGFSEHGISFRVYVSKTAVDQAINEFKISRKLTDFKRSSHPGKTSACDAEK